ncbi:plexin-B1-like [Oncorhynchus masou masou]|uniref:plexin-B1-like n=1 Tax=Oncorhynchus masou masou TaxID=90313 RepID=UPI003183275F
MPPGMMRHGLSVLVAVPAPVLLLLLAAGWPSYGLAWASSPYPTFTRNDTLFEHMTLHPDPAVGRVYVGAQDRLFQLDRHLTAELQFDTGPVTDSRECLPPVTEGNCPQARPTSNHNKLLLVDPYSMELITCGSVNQGICQKRSLDSVGTVLFSAERPVDTQYVAANHPNVSTVGLVVRSRPDRQPVLFVGRGYTSSHPPISTRNLVQEPVFSYEETAKLSVAGRLSEYDHHFVASFAQRQHVYFLFYRRDLKSQSREYRTYVSRVCLDDQAYYSYVEVPLACRSAAGKSYNLLQAVRLGLPPRGSGGEAGKAEVLLGVFSTHQTSSTRPSEDSALCMFNLDDLDQRINSTRDLCYTQFGRAEGVGEAAYIEYEVKSNCANLPSNTLDAYPCGSDHTPSPMASRVAVEAEPILDSPSTRLTAVAVSVRAGHTIAFLGDSKGNLRKVFLGPNGEVEEYAVVSIQANAVISSDLLLDQSEEHLFIMTSTMLQKRPVAECHEHLDCQACLSAHDPYCGWCVLEGRCGQQAQCSRGAQAGQWLWSFDMEQKCLTIQSLSPSNISRQEKRSISLSVLGLAVLEEDKSYSCFFHDSESPATVTDMGVTCLSPDPHRVLTGPPGQDFVMVTLSLRFGDVIVTATEFTFYDCTAAKQLSGSVPCRGCVLSRWGCNWCVHQHTCTHKPSCDEGVIIYNEHFKLPTPAPPTTVSPTTVPPTTTTTAPPTTTTATIATTTSIKAPTTIATALEPMTTTLSTTTTPEPTTLPNPAMPTEAPTTAMQAEAPTIRPPTTLAEATTPIPETTTSEAEEQTTAEELVAEPESETVGPVVTPGNMELAAETEVATVMTKDRQPFDDLTTLIPLAFPPETSPLVTAPPPRELDKALSLAEPPLEVQPTPVSYPFPAPFPLGEPVDSDLTFHLDLTEAPSLLPLDHLHPTDAEGQGAEPEVLLWPREEVEEEAEDTAVENDTSTTFSATSVLSGDGEAADHFLSGSAYPQLLDADSELDYQYDSSDTFLPGDSGSYVSWGSSACPCVEKVQGSHLLPVRVARKITLFARNLHLYQDTDLDYECVLVIEGQTVVVDAYVEMDEMIPSLFDITCQLHQYSYSAPVDEYNAMVYVKRRDTFHVDSSHDLYDLMTEMMDMSSDLVGSGIPFLDYRRYAERIFFPGHRESPLRRDLDVQESRRATVEQGLVQLSNLLNSKLFLTKFIHTLESQRTFSPRDRAYVASLLTVALHGKLEYFTDILKTLLNDLVEQYVVKNPKLMLRRTETVVEKLLTNWMSISLYAFLRDSAGESLYMLFRAIKHQVDKGPVDAVTGKAKYTLNDNRLLREDVEYKTLTLNVLMQGGGVNETQPLPSKVLDIDTITQVKEKLLDQVYKGTSFSHRPHTDSLDLEWRSGVAGHLILSDEDLTSIVQGNWKRLNTLQHYKVADGATVALVPRHSKHIHHDNHDYVAGEKTPMLEDADEGGVRLWHLVKAGEEPELPKHRRGSVRERAKAIPEIYLTRLLSMKGTLQKFVDDLFTVILSTSRPVPLAVKYFFDLLDDQAQHHAITDPETIHIWKTNSLPLRFWINIVKNPQFIFDVQPSDHVDAVLTVISQTFMDSCTTSEHKLGRDSPINKLLYARDIPRYKQMVERYYADIRQTISASDQEMNSALAELSRNYSGELNYLVALHELYKYINKYYDQIIGALEEDSTAQKMQLGYRLQQIAAAVENKVTDL